MWEFIISTYGSQILLTILCIIGSACGILARKFLNTETKRRVAKIAVMAVEQVFKNLHGQAKMEQALEYAAELLARYGIKFNAQEMRILLEAALGEFNKVFDCAPLEIADGVDVDELDDDQLRAVLKQMGYPAPVSFTREELLAALDEAAEQANT